MAGDGASQARGVQEGVHVGMNPQRVNAWGLPLRGQAPAERDKIMRDGGAIDEAGAFRWSSRGCREHARELTGAVAVCRRAGSAASQA